MTSVKLHDPENGVADTLRRAAESIRHEHVTLRELLEMIGEQGLLIFCMFLTVPFMIPVSIPGLSTVLGLVILLIGIGVALNRVPWLPRQLMDRAIAAAHLVPALERAASLFARVDRLIRPRLLMMTHDETMNRVNGLMVVGLSLLLMLPLGPIPFSNFLPALSIALFAAGMLQRDGLFVLAGYVGTVVTVGYFIVLAVGFLAAGHGIKELLSVAPYFSLLTGAF